MHSISYGNSTIDFTLNRKKVKNINLTVKPNLEVIVSANDEVPLEYIEKFILSKAPWIEKKLNYYKRTQKIDMGKKQYISGESFKYLGRQYRLKVIPSDEEYVKYFRGYIHLYVKDKENYVVKKQLIDDWYMKRSKIIYQDSIDRMYRLVEPYKINKPKFTIRKMNKRWGSCYINQGRIVLNKSLIKAPKDCIDYVVLHELIHFKHKNHDEKFFLKLDILMPNWRTKKKILDEEVVREL